MLDKIKALFCEGIGREIYDTALRTATEQGMLPLIKRGVLVGLSGGADSVMLLAFLVELRRREMLDFVIAAAHVNHGIRDGEADLDEQFCRELCNALDIPLTVVKKSVPEIALNCGMGIEEAAREVRYSAFADIILGRNDISAIAVAHNMSDNAETVIFNILRGSGSRGASGIRPVRDNIVRPLINVGKKDILSALTFAGIPYAIDSTNASTDYTRNYIRHEIIPRLSRVSVAPEEMIKRFSDNMRSDDDFISSEAKRVLAGRIRIPLAELSALHYSLFVRVLSTMAEAEGAAISAKIAADIYKLLDRDNFSYSLIGNSSFVVERGVCFVRHANAEKVEYCFEISEGTNILDPFGAELLLVPKKIEKTYLNVYKISIQANLSSAIISGRLYLRPKKDGDTVFYGGMTHKLKKLFSDRKIPLSKRERIPILCDDKGVLWVPGFGVRDDGASKDGNDGPYVVLGIRDECDNSERLYSGSEYK